MCGALAIATSMSGGRGCRASDLVADLEIIFVGPGLSGLGISVISAFSRLDVVVAGVGGGTLIAVGSLRGGILGTVDARLEFDAECAADDVLEFRVLVV